MSGIQNKVVAVFCGSRDGNDPIYVSHADILGGQLAANGFDIVYGGGNKGIMGAIANAHMKAGGKITGVIPKMLMDFEHGHTGLTEMIITTDMHERKRTLYERCEAAIVLPGGYGTLDELFEMLTWNQLNIHSKQLFILNSGGFYNHLAAHLRHLEQSGFLYERVSDRILFYDEPATLVSALRQKL